MQAELKLIIDVFLRLAKSRKFWVLLLSAIASLGFELSEELQALIILAAGVVFAGTTAWEDSAEKSGNATRETSPP